MDKIFRVIIYVAYSFSNTMIYYKKTRHFRKKTKKNTRLHG